MCTVTYVPKKGGFVFTSNRDEKNQRSTATVPQQHGDLVYPCDQDKGGTWIAYKHTGTVLCLLNGAFVKHVGTGQYLKSRGQVLLDIAQSQNVVEALLKYDFAGVEPFTLIIAQFQKLIETRWDGLVLHCKNLDITQSQIWSSCTLYELHVQQMRKHWFEEYMKQVSQVSQHSMLSFHTQKQNLVPSENAIMMHREGGGTVSTTSIDCNNTGDAIMVYIDHRNNNMEQLYIQ